MQNRQLSGPEKLKAINEKISYVQQVHNGFELRWESRLPPDLQKSQLISPIMSQEEAAVTLSLIYQLEKEINKRAYQIFPSRSGEGYRVVCFLSKLLDVKIQRDDYHEIQEDIIAFLNDVHVPSKGKWYCDKNLIIFNGPSQGYYYKGDEIASFIMMQLPRDAYSKEIAGIRDKFKAALQVEDHKHGCFYYLPISGFLLFELYPLAQKHNENYNKPVVAAALHPLTEHTLTEIPLFTDVLQRIGFFLTRRDTAQLAMVRKDAAIAANLLESP